jgi:hypothetical protein
MEVESRLCVALHIYIDTIPHAEQRYPTVGDYWNELLPGGTPKTEVRISDMANEDYEFLVALHELVEQHLCKMRGISVETIDAFDIQFEAVRQPESFDEPGDALNAPYHKEHVFATWIERLVAHEMGVDWDAYNNIVNSL